MIRSKVILSYCKNQGVFVFMYKKIAVRIADLKSPGTTLSKDFILK
jgi:hypothetical protein